MKGQTGTLKELNLPYIPIKRISVFNYEKNVSIKEKDKLFSILKEISPLKAELRRRKNPEFLSLVLRSNIPFGPDPDILRELLFKELNYSFDSLIAEVAKAFGIRRVEVFTGNTEEAVQSESGRAFTGFKEKLVYRKKGAKPKRDSIIIDLIELYNLYRALKERAIGRVICVSFFADYNNSYSFLATPGTKLSDIIKSSPKLKELLYPGGMSKSNSEPKGNSTGADIENIRIYHPISGRRIDLQKDLVCEKNSSIFIERNFSPENTDSKPELSKSLGKLKTLVFKPSGGLLFPFPFFKRRISFGAARLYSISKSSCINCLACVDYCPAGLHPSYLYHLIMKGSIDEAAKLNLKACILCGNCSFVCPVSLPLAEVIGDACERSDEEVEEPVMENV